MALKQLANAVLQVETFPCFDVAHNLLAAIEVRNELGGKFSRNHPFASWLFTIAFIFSGSLTANILLGEPVIAPLNNTKQLLVATMMWYFVFFSPSDFAYKTGTAFPIKLIASTLNEMYRVRKIGNGVLQALKFFPNSWLIMIAIGTIRANGSGLMKLLMRVMQKTQTAKDPGFMQVSFSTKISMLAAFLLILERKAAWFGSYELLHFVITIGFVCIKISALSGNSTLTFPLECFLYSKLFGNATVEKTELPNSCQKTENLDDSKKDN